ncbi:nucleoside 2-deoxyribosyltransferase domain-containing protein [Aspergillus candidus]|uniref:Uncharacterized protein n=1 Tax=Aspergillus candidus TaxID=41067 RepID=A0A2I2FM88_ASPCN|nr:hypothetical protein BDW47DRAFT_122184 [Aspergillus candidus]PLB41730.1 hypothetical protein BDW47DRAFT_122184 [Aspergillus candidus]
MTSRSQIICAPSDDAPWGRQSIFLAGTTSPVDPEDWRTTLSRSLSDIPVTIYNPYRSDWDSTWREDLSFAPYRKQVEWELDRQERADLVVVYFHPATQAPVSLLELGLWARTPGKVIVGCPAGYWKWGNVQITCRKYGVTVVDGLAELAEAVMQRLSLGP